MTEHPFRNRHPSSSLQPSYSRYQSELAVAQYCDAHYGPDRFGVANFSATIAKLCIGMMPEEKLRNALDLGCAVGRACFELASHFDQVTGIDYSTCFIEIAQRIKKRGRVCYRLPEEGELISDHQACLAELGLAEAASNVAFCQGDAQFLDARFCDYDLVLAANLIDRLSCPAKFLANIYQRLAPGGLLVIASPYNWLEDFTPKKHWLGGRFCAGTPVDSLKGLTKRLRKHFTLVAEPVDIEFVIRETARSYHHNISQVTCWQRDF